MAQRSPCEPLLTVSRIQCRVPRRTLSPHTAQHLWSFSMDIHEASVPISPAPRCIPRGQLARALGTFVPIFPKARGLRHQSSSWCTWLYWVGTGRVTLRHVSPCPPLDPYVRLSPHTAHERGCLQETSISPTPRNVHRGQLARSLGTFVPFPYPLPQGLRHVRGFPVLGLLCPI